MVKRKSPKRYTKKKSKSPKRYVGAGEYTKRDYIRDNFI